jgi:hypothetical protein
MSTFTVHVPPGIADAAARAERTVFVRDGFDWPAFLLGPVALLYRGLWRATLAWALAAAALVALALVFGLAGPPRALLYLVLAALTGLEAAEARRRALGRAGFIPAALLCGVTREGGERAFFAGSAPLGVPLPARSGPPRAGAGERPRVLGLFPAPDRRGPGGRP